MNFKVEIKNIGKLADAELRIGRFTVFAGPNNTGKSFVSKLLYSLFDAMNANKGINLVDIEDKLVIPLKRTYHVLIERYRQEDSDIGRVLASSLDGIDHEVKRLEGLVEWASIDELFDIIIQTTKHLDMAADVFKSYSEEEKKLDFGDDWDPFWETAEKWKSDAKLFIVAVFHAIQDKFQQNLIQNFQVPRLSDLNGDENVSPKVNVENFGSFKFSNEEIEFEMNASWIKQSQQYSSVIYLESPVYWKLKNALEDFKPSPGFFGRSPRARLTGVPGYFYDLAKALKFEYTGDVAFPDVYERLTGSDVMGGKIAISKTGDLSFQENGRNFSLPVTAMGIANLGILALLIERKVLDKGSFLFIDEPEAHLHPSWQVLMAEALFELSRQGVNVVIATHSADLLKWLEVHVKKQPDDEPLVALNQFPVNGREVDEDFETRMAKIKQELTKPFSDLYLEGLL